MLRNQSGISVYTVLSIILFVALVFILAVPNFYNLDKEQNTEDCINSMKQIWVATTDYMKDTNADFNGDLSLLTKTPKVQDPKNKYLQSVPYCPETSRQKSEYVVYGKYVAEQIGTEVKHNFGVIVLCPNMSKYHKHMLDKAFYENMDPTQLQNYMIEDMDYIDKETGSNGARKDELLKKYIEIWKTDPNAFSKRKENSTALRAILFPDKFGVIEAEI
jgi:competence protein ComGC